MDLRAYYLKIREAEATIEEEFPVVKSLTTPDGGRAGRLAEVSRAVAARMLIDGVAELASGEEAKQWRTEREEARKAAEKEQKAARIQFTVLSPEDLQTFQRGPRAPRKERE